jgi:hypothetical protein
LLFGFTFLFAAEALHQFHKGVADYHGFLYGSASVFVDPQQHDRFEAAHEGQCQHEQNDNFQRFHEVSFPGLGSIQR